MVHLFLWAEGSTEQVFADTVLKPHLANREVYLRNATKIAHARRKGKVHRGGGRRYLPMKDDIQRLLRQEQGPAIFFTTMIDLYAIHPGFPGLAEAEQLRHTPEKRVEFLEDAFAKDIGDPRFVPYIQLHEFEAYLFSDPTWFRFFYGQHEKQIRELVGIASACGSPESIDDGQHSAPSKRIIAQFPDYEDAKPTVGPQVAELIGLDSIRKKCPHFSAWLTRLEKLSGVG